MDNDSFSDLTGKMTSPVNLFVEIKWYASKYNSPDLCLLLASTVHHNNSSLHKWPTRRNANSCSVAMWNDLNGCTKACSNLSILKAVQTSKEKKEKENIHSWFSRFYSKKVTRKVNITYNLENREHFGNLELSGLNCVPLQSLGVCEIIPVPNVSMENYICLSYCMVIKCNGQFQPSLLFPSAARGWEKGFHSHFDKHTGMPQCTMLFPDDDSNLHTPAIEI